ncbi:MAG TPA: carboxypeptidase regulatory-like domain-containing protein [Blastocatellia bacterium]
MSLKRIVKVFCLLIAFGLGGLSASAQSRSSSADLTGIVSDPSKSPVPGATVIATNIATGLARNGVTDANGVYRIPLLPPGEYEVKIQINGFNTQIKRGITLTVGETIPINFEVSRGGTIDSALVEIDQPLIEPERTHQASTITQRPINNLPINGRNFLDFARLTPGVIEESPAITSVQVTALTTSGLSFSGQNGRANTVQIDGVDNNDIVGNGVRPTISQEAVNEFQINRNAYSAEFGRAAGGIINIVSKSGTNQFHGNVYNYFRNERLDARNAFATGQPKDPPFKRNQPGFTFGGPIRKDRTFFFTAYEGLFRRESAITTLLADSSILQPTPGQQDLINTLIGSGSPQLAAQGLALQALLTTSPNGAPPLNGSFPANRRTFDMFNSSNGVFPILQNSSTGSVRIDHGLSEQDFIFFRYSLTNNSQNSIGVGGLVAPSGAADIGSRDNTVALGETHLFRNGWSNEFRAQYSRNSYNVGAVDPFGPRIQVNGIAFFGRDFTLPSERDAPRLQFIDNFSLPLGRHEIKFGADVGRYRVSTMTAVFLGGNIEFSQLPIPLGAVLDQSLGNGAAAQLSSAVSALGRPDLIPVITTQPLTTVQQINFGFPRAITQGFGNPNIAVSGYLIGTYLQDGFKVKPNLYLSYGMRYDYEVQPQGTPRDNNNIGPRFGFAYSPFNNGRTVIRGGGGLYYQSVSTGVGFVSTVFKNGAISSIIVTADPRVTPISPASPCGQQLANFNVPPSVCFYQSLVNQGLLTFPSNRTIQESDFTNLLGLTRNTGTNRIVGQLANDLVNPYSAQASLGVDRQFGRDWNLSINYLFNRGLKLLRFRQANALPNPAMLDALGRPSLTGRVDPTILSGNLFESAGSSTYHGATVSLTRRFSKGYQVIGSYTYSKTISDVSDINFEQGPQDPTNSRDDRSLSSFDLRHRLTLAAIFESPYRIKSGSPWYERVLADFYVSPIITARSGFPFNIRTGFDVNLDTVNNDRPFAVGRNTFIGPDFFTTDLRVGRQVRFNGDSPFGLEFIFDAFNLFNRTNFKEVNNITNTIILDPSRFPDVRVKGNSAIPASQFSGFTSAYDPRIIQLGLKLNF